MNAIGGLISGSVSVYSPMSATYGAPGGPGVHPSALLARADDLDQQAERLDQQVRSLRRQAGALRRQAAAAERAP